MFRLVTAEFRRFCTAPRLERKLSTEAIALSSSASGSAVALPVTDAALVSLAISLMLDATSRLVLFVPSPLLIAVALVV